MNAIHIRDPRIAKIRAAVQSLAGRNHYPCEDHKFRGLIDERSWIDLTDGESTMDTWCHQQADGSYLYELPGTGLLIRKTEFVRGMFIFTGRDQTDLEFRP